MGTSEAEDRLATLGAVLEVAGLRLRGGFQPLPGDGVPPTRDGRPSATLLLVGSVGGSLWPAFSTAPECGDGRPHPLDRWTRRILEPVAAACGATAHYPFDGPPWLPFQRWARRAESVHPSPLGLLIHPDHGLWHAYRGALSFAERLALPPRPEAVPSPCETCVSRPCLHRCPVSAVGAQGLDVSSCRTYLRSAAGDACLAAGCLARAACPVGAFARYPEPEARFHMAAFRDPKQPSAGED